DVRIDRAPLGALDVLRRFLEEAAAPLHRGFPYVLEPSVIRLLFEGARRVVDALELLELLAVEDEGATRFGHGSFLGSSVHAAYGGRAGCARMSPQGPRCGRGELRLKPRSRAVNALERPVLFAVYLVVAAPREKAT